MTTTDEHKECYGKMFPNPADSRTGERISGKALWFEHKPAGGMPWGPRTVGVDVEGWDNCRSCTEFEHCHKLSMSLVTLGVAVGAT
jgi:hypothetical protein